MRRKRKIRRKQRRIDIDRIIRKDENDGEIRRNAFSVGYQVFQKGIFIIFEPNVNRADQILDEVQRLQQEGVKIPWLRQYG